MTEEKKLTGYPSIDKPWLKYYRKQPIREINAEQTIYELVFNSNHNNMEVVAVGFWNKELTFNELKLKTDKLAGAFINSGLKYGDIVLIGMTNCPEVIMILLALNKIGVISRWFDLRAGHKDIEEYVNDSKCRCVIILDMLVNKIDSIISNTDINQIIVVNPVGSSSLGTRILKKAKDIKEGAIVKLPSSRYIWLNKFINKYADDKVIKCVEFDKTRPSIMIQSSGTTGKPKVIVHSDYSCTSMVKKIAYSDLPLGLNKTLLTALPPWIAYGLGNALILPLALGMKVEMCPSFEPDSVFRYLGKFNISFAAPFHYRYIRDNFNLLGDKQKNMLKKIECLVSGGDKISSEENKEMEKIFNTKIVNGYGNNESWGAITVNPVNNNTYGSVGIPKYEDIIVAFDIQTGDECKYNEEGELCVLTDTAFLKYEKNEKETNNIKKIHRDGKMWIHTGDLGFVDENGFIYLNGRCRRVITRGGFKISAYEIEEKMMSYPLVKECVVVEVYDKEEEHVPFAYIVLNSGLECDGDEAKNAIFEMCKKEFKENEIPKYIVILDNMPYTPNGKYDFRSLESKGNEYVLMLEEGDSLPCRKGIGRD